MSKRIPVYLRVVPGSLAPADPTQTRLLRERGYKVGDLLKADLTKPRNPKFNGLVHKLGELVTQNVEGFAHLDSHAAIKRLQAEGGIYCDDLAVSLRYVWQAVTDTILALPGMESIRPALAVVGSMLPAKALVTVRVPRSISFATLDEGEYRDCARQICQYLSLEYWPGCTADEIEAMAECWVDAL